MLPLWLALINGARAKNRPERFLLLSARVGGEAQEEVLVGPRPKYILTLRITLQSHAERSREDPALVGFLNLFAGKAWRCFSGRRANSVEIPPRKRFEVECGRTAARTGARDLNLRGAEEFAASSFGAGVWA